MKIKPCPRKKKINPRAYHYWLVEEQPKKKGRLSQLQKRNRKQRRLNLGGAQ
jgi:hypothetical protein